MLFGVVTGPTEESVKEKLETALPYVDGIEWRLDLFSSVELIKSWPKKSLFTLRGGSRELTEKWLSLAPDYFDLDLHESGEWAEEIIQKYSNVRFILSYHNFENTPENLQEILEKMKKVRAFAYKIATWGTSTLDALRMLIFVQANENVIGVTMGEKGQSSRILGPVVGNFIDYVALENENTLGQLTIEELCRVYPYQRLKKGDPIYALLGDPVCYSIGHKVHNQKLSEGVYVKLQILREELGAFSHLAKSLPFKGFSVTMPLKTAARSIVHQKSEGPINTINVQGKKWVGSNTDGAAAVYLLEKYGPLTGKKCLILGAGGAAHAFALACRKSGAKIMIANRTKEHAMKISLEVEGEVYGLNDFPADYDILIQATSVGMSPKEDDMPISPEMIRPGCIVLEAISSPEDTQFLLAAKNRGCITMNGKELFIAQSTAQLQAWAR